MFEKSDPSVRQNAPKPKNDLGEVAIQAMPTDFYNGQNPVVEFKEVKKEIDLAKFRPLEPTRAEKQDFDKQSAARLKTKNHPANLFTNPKFLLLVGGVIFILAIIGGGIYFWSQSRTRRPIILNNNTNNNSQLAAVRSSTIDNQSVDNTSVITTTSDNKTTTSSLSVDTIEFPSKLLGFGQDYDGDKLSDKAELLLGSDPSLVDSDQDGYLDGHEVFYLYNPAKVEPNRLIGSGQVLDYQNPNFNYKIYYPASWTYGNVDSGYRDMLFTALNGESVEIKVFDLSSGQTFAEWFAKYAPKENIVSWQNFISVFEQIGQVRDDKLAYYFVSNDQVYALVYHASNANQVNYQQIMEMMARSFRTKSNNYIKQWSIGSFTSSTVITTSTISSSTNEKISTTTSSTAAN